METCIIAAGAGIRQFESEGSQWAAACLQAAGMRDEGLPLELSLHDWASDAGYTDEDVDEATDEDAEGLVAASDRPAVHRISRPGGGGGGGASLQAGELSRPQELSLRDWGGVQSRMPAPSPGFRFVWAHCIEQLYCIRCNCH